MKYIKILLYEILFPTRPSQEYTEGLYIQLHKIFKDEAQTALFKNPVRTAQ